MNRTVTVVVDRVRSLALSSVVASLLLAVALTTVVLAVTGTSPSAAFGEIWRGATTGNGPRTVADRATPIIGMALAVSLPLRTGTINLGVEGQMIVGGWCAAVVGINLGAPQPVLLVACFAGGAAGGALWAAIPALTQVRLQVPILISSLLLNTPARALTSWLTDNVVADPAATSISTAKLPDAARVPTLGWFAGASASAVVVAAVALAIAVYNSRTAPGYQSLMTGLNQRFARYGGVGVERQTLVTMLASGGVAGLVGAHLVAGQAGRFVDGDLSGTGFAWTGLLVCLLGASRVLPMLAGGAFIAFLQTGGQSMERKLGVSQQLTQMLLATVILAIAVRVAFPSFLRRKRDEPGPDDLIANLDVT